MHLFSRNKALVALSMGALAALGACGDDVTVPPAVTPAETVSISPSNANMNVGESLNFAVQITGGATGTTLASCTSSSASVATAAVNAGACRVTAVAAGNATITATSSTGKSAAAAVSVAAPAPAISNLRVSPTASSIGVGQRVTIVPTVDRVSSATTVTYAYTTSSAAIATVAASGEVTAVAPGIATITVTATAGGVTLTSAATVTVTALPAGITALNVTPTAVTLSAGATTQVVANVQQPTGAAAATVSYGTTAPSVATVSNTGVITAVGAGSAVITVTATSATNTNFAAATLSASVAVTVNPAAQISIASITTPGGSAVDLAGVNGQITVTANLATNGNNVSSVQLFACAVGTTCPAAGQLPVAQQTFGSAGASNGAISFLVNTAAFTVTPDFSSATTLFKNGQTNLVATITSAGSSSSANSNLAVLNLTNTDGFAATHTAPTNMALDASGNAWYGGPVASGRGSAAIVPVIYTAGRSITTAVVTLNGCRASSSDTLRFTAGTDAAPWSFTYGTSTTAPASGKFINCTRANTATYPTVSAIDNNNVALNVSTVSSFKTSPNTTVAVNAPASIRTDYQAPSTNGSLTIGSQNGSANSWVNAAFKFDSVSNVITLPTDSGVGIPTTRVLQYTGCPVASDSTTATWTTVATGADIPECATSQSNTVYLLRYRATDRLGNQVTTGNIVYSGRFGVDKTAPRARYASTTRAANSILATASGDSTLFQVEALDDRSGLRAPANSGEHFLVRANRMTTTNRAGACVVGSYPTVGGVTATNAGGSFITAPNCLLAAMSGSFEGTSVDGFSIYPAVTASTVAQNGYYTYRARVRDEAGNTTTLDLRSVLYSPAAPYSVAADDIIAPITATFTGPFTGVFKDSVETEAFGLRLRYRNGGSNTLTFAYPLVASTAVAFDNTITRDSVSSLTTPFTSGVRLYTNLEYTNNDGTIAGTPVTGQVDSLAAHGLFARNFAGRSATNFSSFLAGITTFDGTKWSSKDTTLLSFSMDVSSNEGFNAPGTGVRARVFGSLNLANSPFARVDFYREVSANVYEYAGSVDGTTTPCSNPGSTCNVYIGENGSQRAYTYVLRSAGRSATSFDNISVGLGSGKWIAVGVRSTNGRGLVANPSTFADEDDN